MDRMVAPEMIPSDPNGVQCPPCQFPLIQIAENPCGMWFKSQFNTGGSATGDPAMICWHPCAHIGQAG